MTPDFIAFVNTVFVPVGLMLIMFSMGLTLALRDFALVLSNGRLVAAGLCGQPLLMPILGLALGALFGLGPELALGLFILAVCPARTQSNALTFVGPGTVALAVVLPALSRLLTASPLTALQRCGLPFFPEGAGRGGP